TTTCEALKTPLSSAMDSAFAARSTASSFRFDGCPRCGSRRVEISRSALRKNDALSLPVSEVRTKPAQVSLRKLGSLPRLLLAPSHGIKRQPEGIGAGSLGQVPPFRLAGKLSSSSQMSRRDVQKAEKPPPLNCKDAQRRADRLGRH